MRYENRRATVGPHLQSGGYIVHCFHDQGKIVLLATSESTANNLAKLWVDEGPTCPEKDSIANLM